MVEGRGLRVPGIDASNAFLSHSLSASMCSMSHSQRRVTCAQSRVMGQWSMVNGQWYIDLEVEIK